PTEEPGERPVSPKKQKPARSQGRARPPHHRSRSSCSRGPLPPSPPAEAHKGFDCVPMATLGFGLHDCIRPVCAAATTSIGFVATPSIAVFWINRRRCDPAHICGNLVLDYQLRSSCEQYARRPVVPRAWIRELRHQRRLLRRSTRKTRQSWSLALVQEGSRSIAGPVRQPNSGGLP